MGKKKQPIEDLTGITFLDRIARLEAECATVTKKKLPKIGVKAPKCYEALGMALALLDCAGCCYWGCAKGDHRLEFLLARAASSAYAGLSLAVRGYYDQALSSGRPLGEIANLIALFFVDRPKLNEWKQASEEQRKKLFGAVKVRLAFEGRGLPVPIDEDRYAKLSGYSIHANTDSIPQGHNAHGQGITIPVFQEAGFLMALNEIALPIGFILNFGIELVDVDAEIRKSSRDVADVLLNQVGGVVVTVQGRPWYKLS